MLVVEEESRRQSMWWEVSQLLSYTERERDKRKAKLVSLHSEGLEEGGEREDGGIWTVYMCVMEV